MPNLSPAQKRALPDKDWDVHWRDWHTKEAKVCDPEYRPYHLRRAADYIANIAARAELERENE